VSEYLIYEPLEDPRHPPQHLPSPHSVLSWQAGDAFDCASLLASLLLGAGFDAYVVVGYAPRATTLADQSGDPCLLLAGGGGGGAEPGPAAGEPAVSLPAPLPVRPRATGVSGMGAIEAAPKKKRYMLRPKPKFASKVLAEEEADAAPAGGGDGGGAQAVAATGGGDGGGSGAPGSAGAQRGTGDAAGSPGARRSTGSSTGSASAVVAQPPAAEAEDGGEEDDGDVPGRSKRVHAWVLVLPGRREVCHRRGVARAGMQPRKPAALSFVATSTPRPCLPACLLPTGRGARLPGALHGPPLHAGVLPLRGRRVHLERRQLLGLHACGWVGGWVGRWVVGWVGGWVGGWVAGCVRHQPQVFCAAGDASSGEGCETVTQPPRALAPAFPRLCQAPEPHSDSRAVPAALSWDLGDPTKWEAVLDPSQTRCAGAGLGLPRGGASGLDGPRERAAAALLLTCTPRPSGRPGNEALSHGGGGVGDGGRFAPGRPGSQLSGAALGSILRPRTPAVTSSIRALAAAAGGGSGVAFAAPPGGGAGSDGGGGGGGIARAPSRVPGLGLGGAGGAPGGGAAEGGGGGGGARAGGGPGSEYAK
jgi:hypothetical protein